MKAVLEFLRAYKNYDPAAKSLMEIALLYPGPKAIFLHRCAHLCYRGHLYFLARFIAEFNRWLTGIEIHPGAVLGRRIIIDHGMGVVIGETAEVGDDCILFHGVTLGGLRFNSGKRHPTVGTRVLIGAGAKVLGPVTLGDGCRIGANTVVTHNVPPATTFRGPSPRATS